MEEIYKQYLQYDFNNSDEYKEFKDKFPLDQNETIEDHHKRFYKSHICREFDVNYKPPQSSNTNNQSLNFHTTIHINIQIKTLFIINFQFIENLFSLYNSLKLKNRKEVYQVHKAKTHQ